MHRRFRRACAALADHISTTVGTYSDLDLTIARATTSDDVPPPEHSVWALAAVVSSSPPPSRAFALSFTRRFGRTRSCRVALKCLLLLHRLIRILPSDHPFAADLLHSRSNALISLHPRRFFSSSSDDDDLTAFLRSYARLLDEVLTCHPSLVGEPSSPPPPPPNSNRMEEAIRGLEQVRQLQKIVDLAMECRPSGAAARSLLVRSAMKHVARDSFACYSAIQKVLPTVLDGLPDMPRRSCVAGLGVYRRAADQAGVLVEFYHWCRMTGLCGPYEYPAVEKIPQIQVRAVESLFANAWGMTESPSSSPSSCPSTLTEVEGNRADGEAVINWEWERFEETEEEEEEELKPLVQFVEFDETSWDVLPWTGCT